ncbi:DDE-type integrase/transposase/recombinase [Kitasatospora sp. NPDC050463]|uniref:DDE-type integrase/transposase/recombinase n=1 Tax=Kitasatospora sp. NPDC050463 TaxID=3155786 RepID=UPI0033D9403C
MARCTVEHLMRELGITGAVRGKKVITTIAGPAAEIAPDLVDRQFVAGAPNRYWAADFTHAKTWSGVVYVAFVADTFSRRIIGWSAAISKETRLVLDALDMALWPRDRDGFPHQRGELIHHSDAGSQYTSFRLAEHLDAAGIAASIGSVGDAYYRTRGDSAGRGRGPLQRCDRASGRRRAVANPGPPRRAGARSPGDAGRAQRGRHVSYEPSTGPLDLLGVTRTARLLDHDDFASALRRPTSAECLAQEDRAGRLLDLALARLKKAGLVGERTTQRTDFAHVLTAVRDLARLELVTEAVRAALDISD